MLTSDAVSEIVLSFVSNGDFDSPVNKALALVGNQLEISRCCLFVDSPDGLSTRNTHEWCAQGVEPQLRNLQTIPYSSLPSMKEFFVHETVKAAEDKDTLPGDMCTLLEPLGLRSVVFTPLRVGNQGMGFFCFGNCSGKRQWPSSEIQILKTITDVISLAFAKQLFSDQLSVRFEGLFKGNPSSMAVIRWEDMTFMDVNDAFAETFGYSSPEEIIGKSEVWAGLFVKSEAWLQIREELCTAGSVRKDEVVFRRRDGNLVHMRLSCDMIESPGKKLLLVAMADITEKKAMEQQILELTIRDSLTGVYNRRYVFDRLEGIISEYLRCGRNFCISILDIDCLREVNDTQGHLAGDFLLKEFALTISSTIRQYDLLGRFGGGAFIVITTSANGQETSAMIERVMQMVRGSTFIFKGQKIRFTFSAGVADSSEFQRDALSPEEILSLAEKRLHAAKQAGRNRCVSE